MKALCRFYPADVIEWTKKDTGEVKRGWKQAYDLDQGAGVRVFQGEAMHMIQGDVAAPGEYEVEFAIEKDRRGFVGVRFISKRLVKADSRPQAVVG